MSQNESDQSRPSDSERIEKHLRLLILAVLRRDETLHAKAVEKYYAPNAELIHPLLGLRRGRQDILALYQFYSRVLRRISVNVHQITISNDHSAAVVELTQHIRFNLFPFMTLQMHMLADLQLTDTADGQGKLIARQHDIYPADSLLRLFPIVRHVYALFLLATTVIFSPMLIAFVNLVNNFGKFASNATALEETNLKVLADPTPHMDAYDYSIKPTMTT